MNDERDVGIQCLDKPRRMVGTDDDGCLRVQVRSAERGENITHGPVHPSERIRIKIVRITPAPETSDFRIVKIRRVRNVEVDECHTDGWVGRVAPSGREQRLVFREVAGVD